jgi:hypothetical protein
MSWLRTPVAVALIPGMLAFVVRLYGLSNKPLWLDEVITHVRANLPISNLIASSLHNKHFPTYFILASAFDTPVIDEWSPLDMQLGQEARPYTLASCLVMLALWGLARIARQSAITFPPSSRSKGERLSWQYGAPPYRFQLSRYESRSDVRYWPKADIPNCIAHVRFRG